MLKPAITSPLTKQEIKGIIQYVSHHIGYVPIKVPTVIFASSAKKYANLFENYETRSKELNQEKIAEINSKTAAFFDHLKDNVVFQGFSYRDGTEIDTFVIPMSTIVHEFIHFFQYATGTFGSYKIMYEGTNDILSCMLADDPSIDYKEEAVYAMGLAMEINEHDFFRAIQWMKTFTTHSDKNSFVHRSIKQCAAFSKYDPRRLMRLLENNRLDKIENEETRLILKRYNIQRIVKLIRAGHKIIHGTI